MRGLETGKELFRNFLKANLLHYLLESRRKEFMLE